MPFLQGISLQPENFLHELQNLKVEFQAGLLFVVNPFQKIGHTHAAKNQAEAVMPLEGDLESAVEIF